MTSCIVFLRIFRFNQNYGVLGVLDRLHGTDTMFRASRAYDRHIMLLGLEPLSETYPENMKGKKSEWQLFIEGFTQINLITNVTYKSVQNDLFFWMCENPHTLLLRYLKDVFKRECQVWFLMLYLVSGRKWLKLYFGVRSCDRLQRCWAVRMLV